MLQVILGILAVAIAAASGFMLVQQMELQVAVQDQRENVRRLDVAAEAVAAKLGTPAGSGQGSLFAPGGVNADGIYELPTSLGVVKTTVAGVPFRYCPYAPTTGDLVVSGDGYVVSSPAPPSDVDATNTAALIVAGGRIGSSPPSCGDVHLVNGRFLVDGGLVRAVTRVKGISDVQLTDGNSFEMWVAPDASGSGADASHPSSLASAMGIWNGRLPKSMIIHLKDGVYSNADSIFSVESVPAGTTRESKLSIIAASAEIDANATFDPVGSIALVGVSMPQTVLRLGSHNAGSLQNSLIAGALVAPGSSIAFNGGDTVTQGVTLGGDATIQGTLSVSGQTGGSAINVQNGGRLMLAGASVGLSAPGGYGIALLGDLSGTGAIGIASGGAVGSLIGLGDGSRLSFNGEFGGGASQATLLASGSPASLSGGGDIGSGSGGCWNASALVFVYSTGSTSAVVVPDAPQKQAAVAGIPATANQDYVDQQAARQQALAAQLVNRSNWTCHS